MTIKEIKAEFKQRYERALNNRHNTMTLEEKHLQAIREHRFSDFEDLLEMAAKDCAKISQEFAIGQSEKDNKTMLKMLSKIVSDVDKLSEDDDYIIDSDFVQEIKWFLKKFTTPRKPQS